MEFLPGIHMIPNVRLSRAYLIEGDSLVLVDTGMPWNARGILSYINSIGRRPEELEAILMTHSHPDHSSGAKSINKRTGADVFAHSGDTKTHPNDEVSLSYMGVFGSLRLPVPFFQRTGVAHTVEDDEVLPLLGGIRVIHTPGHTPGSTCYLLEDRGVMFSGDTVFSDGNRISRSVPFPGYNRSDYIDSLNKIADLEFDTVCGGHGVPLIGRASTKLHNLLVERPEPPTWANFFKSLPRRISRAKSLHGEQH